MNGVQSPDRISNVKGARRPSSARHPTAPAIMAANGHFAGMGGAATKEQYEHGIQVINEDQEFKCVSRLLFEAGNADVVRPVLRSLNTSPSRKSSPPASTTISYPSSAHSLRANLHCSIIYLAPNLE